MYSPDAGDDAFDPKAKIDNEQMSNKRFIQQTSRALFMQGAKMRKWSVRSLYASTSSRTRSFHVCRFRISANLSPRTSASAGNGREL